MSPSSSLFTLVWPDLASFLHMGGHGPYVWGSFGVVAAALAAEVITLRRPPR